MAEGQTAQRCGGVAVGQTELASPVKGRANSEPRSIAAASLLAAGPKSIKKAQS